MKIEADVAPVSFGMQIGKGGYSMHAYGMLLGMAASFPMDDYRARQMRGCASESNDERDAVIAFCRWVLAAVEEAKP